MEKRKKITVITGACGGLGKAFVETLAAMGEPLLLLGRDAHRLAALQTEICSRFGVTAELFQADLTDDADRLRFDEYLLENQFLVQRLINVAGVDIQKPFSEYTQNKIVLQVRVNFEGAVSLCRLALKYKSEEMEIINICSICGLYPMPYFALYSATKRALWTFSVALRQECKKQGVKVTAVLPGAIPTREDIKEQIKGQGLWGKLAAKSPAFVAKKSLSAVKKNKKTCVPGGWNRVAYCCTKLIPLSLKLHFIAKRWSKISKDAF